MRYAKILAYVISGAVLGIGLVVACDDEPGVPDAAGQADAQSCDCPAPPEDALGRIRQVEGTDVLESTFESNGVSAVCPTGSQVIGGGCDLVGGAGGEKVFLQTSGISGGDGGLYRCTWINPNMIGPITIRARAICLVPPGTPDAGP